MKRCWFGGGLLIFLLVAGLLVSREMARFHLELSEQMFLGAELTDEDRAAAQYMADQVRSKWEDRKKFAAVLTDHTPMEQIDEYFTLLTPEAEEEDFRETCLRLAAQLEALGHGQLLTLENPF
jgi:hypothetical protein